MKISARLRIVLLVIGVLAAATLACSPGASAAPTATTAATVAPTTAATDVPPTTAPEPTAQISGDAGGDTGGTTGGTTGGGTKNSGGTTGGGDTTGGTTGGGGSANAINASNAVDVAELWFEQVTETQLRAVSIRPGFHEVAVFGFDKIPRIYDGDSGELLGELAPMGDSSWGMAYSPDGNTLAIGGGFHVSLYDAESGTVFCDRVVNAFVFKTVWAPDNTAIAVVGQDSSRIDVIGPDECTNLTQILTPDNVILWSVAFSPDSQLLVTGNSLGGIRALDIDSGDEVVNLTTKGAVVDLEFSPDSSRMAACNGSGHVYVWDTSTWEVLLSSEFGDGDPIHPGGCLDGVFNADGTVYVSGGDDGYLNLYDADTGDLLNSFYWDGLPAIESVSFSSDGELLAVARSGGAMSVFSLP